MESGHAIWVLLVGAAIVLAASVGSIAQRFAVPAVVGYLGLGLVMAAADQRWTLLGSAGREAFSLLGDLGIVALLFRVGLESNLAALVAKLGSAALIWTGDVLVSGGLGFLAARHLAGLPLDQSLIVAAALTATSVGVSVAVWQARHALDTPAGHLLVDVAELDDISAIVLMAMVFALLPVLSNGGDLAGAMLSAGGLFVVEFLLFVALCYLFARYLEGRLTQLVARLRHAPERMLSVAGVGIIIAAIAALMGFSLAIGALFAGLVFSRDPNAVRTEANFNDLYAFFTPFFFISIGLQVDLAALGNGATQGLILLVAAVAGKMLGAGLPAWRVTRPPGAMLIAVSMVPRAEIALVVAHQGRRIGVLPEPVYAALVMISMVTCLAAPLALHRLLARWSRKTGDKGHPS